MHRLAPLKQEIEHKIMLPNNPVRFYGHLFLCQAVNPRIQASVWKEKEIRNFTEHRKMIERNWKHVFWIKIDTIVSVISFYVGNALSAIDTFFFVGWLRYANSIAKIWGVEPCCTVGIALWDVETCFNSKLLDPL